MHCNSCIVLSRKLIIATSAVQEANIYALKKWSAKPGKCSKVKMGPSEDGQRGVLNSDKL